jgi:mersacidin/lichenicidin family type 2 lantibiotic
MNAVIRAWKDASFRKQCAAEGSLSSVPHPAGQIELDEREMDLVCGAMRPVPTTRKSDLTCANWACTYSPVVCN